MTHAEGDVLAATDLTADCHGWLVTFAADDSWVGRRTILLGGVRRWTYRGRDRVGLLDVGTDRPFHGEEYSLPAGYPVTLERRVTRGVPRPRSSDWPSP